MTSWLSRRVSSRDLLGLAFVVVAGLAVLVPALSKGASLRDPASGDQLDALIPWARLAWTEVHQGHLPLWNPYSLLGMPLAFNWDSAVFSLPSVVGYLFPLGLAFTVGIVITVVIAGSGVYVLGRVLGLGAIGSAMAATVFELSGPLLGWLGWPVAGVMSWSGWLFASAIVVMRGRHRLAGITWLAVVVALIVYAGEPDTLVSLAVGFAVFVAFVMVQRTALLRGEGPILRPVADLVVSGIAGFALSAPLLLPGLAPLRAAAATGRVGSSVLSSEVALSMLVPGFNGKQIPGTDWQVLSVVHSYVGPVAIVLATTGLWVHRRRPAVRAFIGLGVVSAAMMFASPVTSVLEDVVRSIRWERGALIVLAFVIAALAGFGADALVRRGFDPAVRRSALVGALGCAVVLLVVWVFGRGHLHPAAASARDYSFVWPVVFVAVTLAVVALAGRRPGRTPWTATFGDSGRTSAGVFLVLSSAFLVHTGAPFWSSTPPIESQHSDVVLAKAVGTGLLGYGTSACFPYSWGPVADKNLEYALRAFEVYDPLTPKSYNSTYKDLTDHSGEPYPLTPGIFCPAIRSAAVARLFGISFVLEPPGTSSFPGGQFVTFVGPAVLFRIPGAARATLVPLTKQGGIPPIDAPGTPAPVSYPGPESWNVTVDAKTSEVLRLRLTDTSGWRATIDGQTLSLQRFDGVMTQATVPPGHYVVSLHYRPRTFVIGIGLAVISAAGLALAWIIVALRRGRGQRISLPEQTVSPPVTVSG